MQREKCFPLMPSRPLDVHTPSRLLWIKSCHRIRLLRVTIEVVDEQGTIVKLGDNDVTCQIEGPARLLGLEGSNNGDMRDYTDNHHRAFHGRLLAYIQTTGEKGEIRVKLTSPL